MERLFWRPYHWRKTLTNPIDAQNADTTSELKPAQKSSQELADFIFNILETQSAEDIVRIDLRGKSSIADVMIVTSGRSNRHVNALSDYVQRGLKELNIVKLGIEGDKQNDWVLIDAGDVIVHLFRPEVREFYSLEKLWTVSPSLDDEIDQ